MQIEKKEFVILETNKLCTNNSEQYSKLSMCKEINDVKSNHLNYIAILETIKLGANKLLVFGANTRNHLKACKQMSYGSFKKCYQQNIRL